MNSVELFTGAGGLALGIARAGFKHLAVCERDKYACDTIIQNQKRGLKLVNDWNLIPGDVADFDYRSVEDDVDLLAGGPPCQPFSIGGKHRGPADRRDMFPEMIRAARELRPKAILVENVKGLTRRSFSSYFEYIVLQLTYPEVVRGRNESVNDHLARLEQVQTEGRSNGLVYNVVYRVLNAAQYGVPQKRERVIIVGFRSDLGIRWSFPESTHSFDALLHDQWITGDYWERHRVPRRSRPSLPERHKNRVENLKRGRLPFDERRSSMLTVRDAISSLPNPETDKEATSVPNHVYIPGARSYVGHTGSPIDEPAKVLKAGDHGVPGGENMVLMPDGRVRYFTVREAARLQTFPENFLFHGSWSETMRQLGNAVPVELATKLGEGIRHQLKLVRS